MRAAHSAGPAVWTLVPSAEDGDGHVFDLELVDGFHAEDGEGENAGGVDGLGDEVGRAADGDGLFDLHRLRRKHQCVAQAPQCRRDTECGFAMMMSCD